MSEIYNPLDMPNLAESIGNAMLSGEPSPLGAMDKKRFSGPGIYAIYYLGDFPAYGLITKANADNAWAQPIYVGKAIPAGARKGLQIAATEGTPLASRIREHRRSVIAADNLDIEHFWVRWLVVEPFWIPLGESLLINRYAPVWNALVEGFGNHDAGSGRHAGKRTMWDVLHPGRKNIEKYADRPQTAEHIIHDVMEYLRARIDP